MEKALRLADPDRPSLTYAPLKGFSHYPCLRKIGHIVEEGAQTKLFGNKEQTQAPSLAALLSFIEQTEYDDMDSLKIDYRVLPRRLITTTANDCLRRKCPYFGTSCFVHGSRRRAEAADIVVTNHSLLFCDLVADGGLLPPIRYWVVDEAHGAEAEARRAFSLSLSAEDITRLANRVGADEASRNVFVRAERRVVVPGMEEGSSLFYAPYRARRALRGKAYADAAREIFRSPQGPSVLRSEQKGKRLRDRRAVDQFRCAFQRNVCPGSKLWSSDDRSSGEAGARVSGARGISGRARRRGRDPARDSIDRDGAQRPDERRRHHLGQGSGNVCLCGHFESQERSRRRKLEALLINVGEAMNETLFERTHSTVFASATLAVDNKFDAFESALGLNASEHSTCQMCKLDQL